MYRNEMLHSFSQTDDNYEFVNKFNVKRFMNRTKIIDPFDMNHDEYIRNQGAINPDKVVQAIVNSIWDNIYIFLPICTKGTTKS